MRTSGFLAVLLMLFGYAKLVTATPLRPICDSRVMDKFIKEAKEAENAMTGFRGTLQLPDDVTLPATKVNFKEWHEMDRNLKAEEIWKGLTLFTSALLKARDVTTDSATVYSIEKSYSNIRSITQILKSLDIQDAAASESSLHSLLTVRTLNEFFRVYANFVRGKVKLFITEVCNGVKR
ncbi:erythropoietin isoform X2 [Protopterus annectens]|uniref:erythropoietin isoform X2 n=1 Tax=Protopterus annectens TaxID=7888 RepID=UPI001CFBFF6D|nr:erythropoietin isoform X2 [Protopterus annectens]